MMYAQDYDETLPLNDYIGNGLAPLIGWRDPRVGDSWCSGIYPYVKNSHDFYDTRHNSGATLLFCDGHAKWRKKSAILISDYGLMPKVPKESMGQVGSGDLRDLAF
jgi:prepilin-type processing-associated H-X9-DG protein